ncbi:MAG: hypothetical protein A2Y78_00200 [Acidobacteria bacterium RBG_13_68_16]|nr:MAG: hypothetical protein A2Y78_00200 [Acidobacteria bacterium RBG_13_68_16]
MADAAQYAIDIAARLDASATFEQLDELAAKLQSGGARAGAFEEAIARVKSQLDSASAAAAAAAQRLSDGQAEYRQLEAAALSAAKAAERAAQKNGGVIPPEFGARVDAAKAAVSAYLPTLQRLESESEQAAAAQRKLAQTGQSLSRVVQRTRDRLGDAATKVSTFRGALGDLGGPLGTLGEALLLPVQAFVDLEEWFGTGAATAVVAGIGVAALAAAVVILTAALVAGTIAATAYAVKIADTARSARLAQQAIEAAEPAIAGVSGQYSQLTDQTGLATTQLNGLARSLHEAGVSAAELPAALRAASLAEAALGQGGAAKFVSDIKAGKLGVQEFAATAQQKFGGIVARQMLGLEAQGARLSRNVSGLFADLNIEPVLAGMSTLVGLFDKNSTSGRLLQSVISGVLQPLIDQGQLAAWVVEALFLGFAIGAVKAYQAIKPVVDTVAGWVGLDLSGWELEPTLRAIAKAAEFLAPVILVVVAGVLALAAVVGLLVAVPLAIWIAVMGSLAYVVSSFGARLYGLVTAVQAVVGSMRQLGSDLIAGLVAGIQSGAGAVTSAVTGAVGGAISAAKRQLGIASPSKVFAQIGGYTAEGFAEGVEGGQAQAQASMADLVSPTPALRAAGGEASASSGRAGATVTIGSITIGDSPVAADNWNRLREILTDVFEADAIALGATS